MLSYVEFGDPDREPLVMIAGAGSSKMGWGPLPEALATQYRVICYDPRGLGDSPPLDHPTTMITAADDVATLLDTLAIPRAHILGWSHGSAIAQHFAARHPDRLAALILWSTWAKTDGYLRALFTGLRYPFAQGDLDTAIIVLGPVFSPEFLNSPDFRVLVEAMKPTLPQGPGQLRITVQQWDANLVHDTTALLPTITAPTLVVAGEQDTLAPPRYGREVASLLPQARFELFQGPGSSHALGLERMPELCTLVHEFLLAQPLILS